MPICDTPVILPGVSSLYQPLLDYPLTQPRVISEFYCCYADASHTPPMTPTESVGAMTGSMGHFPPASRLRQVGYFRALLRIDNLMAWSTPTGVAFLCVAACSQVAVVQYVDRFVQATPGRAGQLRSPWRARSTTRVYITSIADLESVHYTPGGFDLHLDI